MGEDAAVEFARRAQDRARGDEGVAADGDGDGGCCWWCCGVGGRGGGGGFVVVVVIVAGGIGARGRWQRAHQIPADAHVCLDDGAPAEDDVLRAVDLGPPRDFVARVLKSIFVIEVPKYECLYYCTKV